MFLVCWDSMAVGFTNEISTRKWVKSPCADDSITESDSNLWTLVSTYIAVAEIRWRAETCFWYQNHQNAHGARVSSYVLPLTFKNYIYLNAFKINNLIFFGKDYTYITFISLCKELSHKMKFKKSKWGQLSDHWKIT